MTRKFGGNKFHYQNMRIRVVDSSADGDSYMPQPQKRMQSRGGINQHFRGCRSGGRGGGGGSFRPTDQFIKRAVENLRTGGDLTDDLEMRVEQETWVKVMVMFGARFARDQIHAEFSRLLENLPLHMINFRNEGKNCLFYIKIRRSAIRYYRNAANRMQDENGQKLTVNVSPMGEPTLTALLPDAVEALKTALVPRFNQLNVGLDLSALHKDTNLLAKGYYLPLNRNHVALAVVQILKDNLPMLNGINLSNNRLDSLSGFIGLTEKFANCQSMDLSYNQIRLPQVFDCLKQMTGLKEVNLIGNHITRRFSSAESLGAELRKRIPGLTRLNGKELAPDVGFEIQKTKLKSLPEPLPAFFPNDECRAPLLNLVKEYLEKYDSGHRQSLLSYYSDHSILTLTCAYHSLTAQSTSGIISSHKMDANYLEESRNLLRCRDVERRRKMVKTGALHVVSLLDILPRTEHNLDSINLDVICFTPNFVIFRMNGLFVEQHSKSSGDTSNMKSRVPRIFSRTMTLVPPNVIAQDDLFITNPTAAQLKKFVESARQATTSTSAPSTSMQTAPQPIPMQPIPAPQPIPMQPNTAPGTVTEADKEVLVAAFTRDSRMRTEYSRKCLEDFNWNYKMAAETFINLNSQGKIPPEAFIKTE